VSRDETTTRNETSMTLPIEITPAVVDEVITGIMEKVI
jgi:hypothetical protein